MKYLDNDELEGVPRLDSAYNRRGAMTKFELIHREKQLVIDGNPVTVRTTDEEIESLIDRIQQYLNTDEGEGSTYTGIAEGTGIDRETVKTIMERIFHV